MSVLWRIRQGLVAGSALCGTVAVVALFRPNPPQLATFPPTGGEQTWPLVGAATADEPSTETTIGGFVRRASTGAVEIAMLEEGLTLTVPAPGEPTTPPDLVGTSLHRRGDRFAMLDWSQPAKSGVFLRRAVVFEVVPRGSWLSRVRRTPTPGLLVLGGLFAFVYGVLALRRARPWYVPGGLATWEEGLARTGRIRASSGDTFVAPDARDGWVLFRPRERDGRAPYRSLEHAAVVPGSRSELLERFTGHARRAVLGAVLALFAFVASAVPMASRRGPAGAPVASASPPSQAMMSTGLAALMGAKSAPGASFDIGLRAPLPWCGDGGAAFYETVAIRPASAGMQVVALRETLVNASNGRCDVPEGRVTADGVDRGGTPSIQLAPFETHPRILSLYVMHHTRRLTVRAATTSALALDLWHGRTLIEPGQTRVGPPPPVVAGESGVPVPSGSLTWTRFRIEQRFPGVSSTARDCSTVSDMVIDDAFIGRETRPNGTVWLELDVAFLRATPHGAAAGTCIRPVRPFVVVRSGDERRPADPWVWHAPRVGARDTHRWALVNGTRQVDLALGGDDNDVVSLDLETGKSSILRQTTPAPMAERGTDLRPEWNARYGDRKAYIARRLLRAQSWDEASRPQVERQAVHVLCAAGGRDEYDKVTDEMYRAPTRLLLDEACE